MLTVLIETRNDEEGLARTLACLIEAVVEGAVRDVIVCNAGSTDQTHRVAELSGCGYLAEGGIAAGIAQARSDWLMFLEPGARLVSGWSDDVRSHVERSQMPARFTPARDSGFRLLSRLFSGSRALSCGLVVRKGQALALARTAGSAEALARGLASRRLNAEIRVAEPASGPR